jgi:transcriptional regulator with XRE-family HTH domain
MTKKETNPVDHHVGARVRARRVLLGMSQEKLGAALGVTFQQVQKYEKGANRIGAGRLENISRVLDVPPSYFFDAIESVPGQAGRAGLIETAGTAPVMGLRATTEALHLNRAFARIMDAKVRRRIIDLVVALANEAEASDA